MNAIRNSGRQVPKGTVIKSGHGARRPPKTAEKPVIGGSALLGDVQPPSKAQDNAKKTRRPVGSVKRKARTAKLVELASIQVDAEAIVSSAAPSDPALSSDKDNGRPKRIIKGPVRFARSPHPPADNDDTP